jgi:hypothetical protein
MQPKKMIANLREVEPGQVADHVLHGQSSLIGAMAWMFGLSFLLTFVLNQTA